MKSRRTRKKGSSDDQLCPATAGTWMHGNRGHVQTAQQAPFGTPSPQVPTYRMNPVSVVIVSPGTTRCFLVSRPTLSLRGFRATGSLISIAILAPKKSASAVQPGTATSVFAVPSSRTEGRGKTGRRAAANGNSQSGGHVDYWQPFG